LHYNNTLLVNYVEVGNRVHVVDWDPSTQTYVGGLGAVILVDGTTDGSPYPVLEIVNSPQYTQKDQLMFAVGGGRDTKNVYGLFADKGGANMH
jgi:hypothetical protein